MPAAAARRRVPVLCSHRAMPPKRAEGGVAKAGTRTSRKKKVPERDPRQPDIAAGLKSQKRQQDRRETTAE